MSNQSKILAGRNVVGAYRTAHAKLHEREWHRGISEEHTPLLKGLVNALEGLGFTSFKPTFDARKTEILDSFFEASNDLDLRETGILEEPIRSNRKDLSVLGITPDMTPSIIAEANDVVLKLVEGHWGKEVELYKDNRRNMNTPPGKHVSMRNSVEQCPANSRVFVGGLGLALTLLYIAESGKATEVIVCEIEKDVIRLLADQVIQWFAVNYPDFQLSIILGDAFVEVSKHGKFDWIFYDLDQILLDTQIADAKSALTVDGVFTNRRDLLYTHDPTRWH